MARGDVTTVIVANAADQAPTDYQPSAGVEVMVCDSGCEVNGTTPNGIPDTIVSRIDGTNNNGDVEKGNSNNQVSSWWHATHFFSNSYYLRHMQVSTSTRDHTFSVIEVG